MSLFKNFIFIDQYISHFEILESLIKLNQGGGNPFRIFSPAMFLIPWYGPAWHRSFVHWLLLDYSYKVQGFYELGRLDAFILICIFCLFYIACWNKVIQIHHKHDWVLYLWLNVLLLLLFSSLKNRSLNYIYCTVCCGACQHIIIHEYALWTKILNSCMYRPNLRWGSIENFMNTVFMLICFLRRARVRLQSSLKKFWA